MQIYDQLALRAVLSGRDVSPLLRHARQRIEPTCPECGSSRIEDNGCSGAFKTFLCVECSHQWDAE